MKKYIFFIMTLFYIHINMMFYVRINTSISACDDRYHLSQIFSHLLNIGRLLFVICKYNIWNVFLCYLRCLKKKVQNRWLNRTCDNKWMHNLIFRLFVELKLKSMKDFKRSYEKIKIVGIPFKWKAIFRTPYLHDT